MIIVREKKELKLNQISQNVVRIQCFAFPVFRECPRAVNSVQAAVNKYFKCSVFRERKKRLK